MHNVTSHVTLKSGTGAEIQAEPTGFAAEEPWRMSNIVQKWVEQPGGNQVGMQCACGGDFWLWISFRGRTFHSSLALSYSDD